MTGLTSITVRKWLQWSKTGPRWQPAYMSEKEVGYSTQQFVKSQRYCHRTEYAWTDIICLALTSMYGSYHAMHTLPTINVLSYSGCTRLSQFRIDVWTNSAWKVAGILMQMNDCGENTMPTKWNCIRLRWTTCYVRRWLLDRLWQVFQLKQGYYQMSWLKAYICYSRETKLQYSTIEEQPNLSSCWKPCKISYHEG